MKTRSRLPGRAAVVGLESGPRSTSQTARPAWGLLRSPLVPGPASCRCSTRSKAQFWPRNRRVPAETMPDADAIPVIDLGPYLAGEPGALDRDTGTSSIRTDEI